MFLFSKRISKWWVNHAQLNMKQIVCLFWRMFVLWRMFMLWRVFVLWTLVSVSTLFDIIYLLSVESVLGSQRGVLCQSSQRFIHGNQLIVWILTFVVCLWGGYLWEWNEHFLFLQLPSKEMMFLTFYFTVWFGHFYLLSVESINLLLLIIWYMLGWYDDRAHLNDFLALTLIYK